MVVEQPQSTRVEEPTLLCNHVRLALTGRWNYSDCCIGGSPFLRMIHKIGLVETYDTAA
jgi:hypothetical protein